MRKKMIEFLVWVLGKLSEEYLVAVSDGNGTLFIGKGYTMNLHLLSIAQVIRIAMQMKDAKRAVTDAAKVLTKLAPEFDKKGAGGDDA